MKELLKDPNFLKVESQARTYVESSNGGSLGKIIKVETQIVEGINYKITFQTPRGPVQVVVWSKPWEETNQVTGVYRNIKTDDKDE